MRKTKTASASAKPTKTGRRKTLLVAKCLTAFLAVFLLSGWSIWSEEKDPEKLLDEMADQSARLYKRCIGLAVDAELALLEFPKERQEIIDRWREENTTPEPKGGGRAALVRKAAGDYASQGKPKQRPPGPLDILPDSTDYDEECGEKVKFCLLPPEPMTKVEEFSYQARTCLRPFPDCGTQRERIAWIVEEKKRLHLSKNEACRGFGIDLCIYRYRQVLTAIQAIAFHETFLERLCLED